MSKKYLKETMKPDKLSKWFLWISAISVLITFFVFGFYFYNFNYELSSNQEVWGAFGSFIGGTLSPILSFMALIALLLTVYLQSKQLQLSSEELEATREELKRSADAQEYTQKAQIKQAKALQISAQISAITKLLEQEDETLKEIMSELVRYSSPSALDKANANTMLIKNKLRKDLAKLYEELGSMGNL